MSKGRPKKDETLDQTERNRRRSLRNKLGRRLAVRFFRFFKKVEKHIPLNERENFLSGFDQEEREVLTFLVDKEED